jgi:RHS repeat-associated protein
MAVTDSNGNPYAEYTMEAFGSVMQKGTSTGYYSQHATDPQSYHITIKEHDPDTGLYYFNARWYDPNSGRFVSQDILRGGNRYLLVNNRPTVDADLDGEGSLWDWLKKIFKWFNVGRDATDIYKECCDLLNNLQDRDQLKRLHDLFMEMQKRYPTESSEFAELEMLIHEIRRLMDANTVDFTTQDCKNVLDRIRKFLNQRGGLPSPRLPRVAGPGSFGQEGGCSACTH